MGTEWGGLWALGGVALGSFGTFATAWMQRTWQSRDASQQRVADRDAEVRRRYEDGAQDLLAAIERLSFTLPSMTAPDHSPTNSYKADKIRDEIRSIRNRCVLMPNPLRRHITEAMDVLANVSVLATQGWVRYDTAHQIAWRTFREMREAIGGFLRNEEVSEKLSPEFEGYVAANYEFMEDLDRQIGEQEDLFRAQQAAGDTS